MRILSIANQKGGTGKTATAQNVGYILAESGLRVLLIDADPQSSLTRACGIEDASSRNLAGIMGGAQPGRLTIKQVARSLGENKPKLIPSDIELALSELHINQRYGRESILKNALESAQGKYDIVIIDCAPSLGLLTINALSASHAVLVPSQPSAVDLRGARLFLNTLEDIQNELNPSLELLGILLTFYDPRISHHVKAKEQLEKAGLPVLPVLIGRSVRVVEAASAGVSVIEYEPNNPQSKNYRELSEIIKSWLKKQKKN